MSNFELLRSELDNLSNSFNKDLNEIISKFFLDGEGLELMVNNRGSALNDLIEKIRPADIPINFDAVKNIDFGDNIDNEAAIEKIYNQTGELYFKSYKVKNEICFCIDYSKIKK